MAQALQMVHDTDPKQDILAAVEKFLPQIEVLGARILLGVYVRPERVKGGIILPDKSRDEDKHQGKVGLVLKVGALAFVADDTHRWGKRVPKPGDWVVYSVGDTFAMELGKQRCRAVEDVDVHMIIEAPDIIL